MTHLQFDAELRERAASVQKAGSAVFIQCVGSREPERPYCSRVCCTHSVDDAIKLKELNPEMNVYHPLPGHAHLRPAGRALHPGPGTGGDLHQVLSRVQAQGVQRRATT